MQPLRHHLAEPLPPVQVQRLALAHVLGLDVSQTLHSAFLKQLLLRQRLGQLGRQGSLRGGGGAIPTGQS